MHILDRIVATKREEVEQRKGLYPIKLLEQSLFFETKPVSLKRYLKREDRVGIIAEIKRRSPSEGDINPHIDVEGLSVGYMQAGASALSVLTDTPYFGGSDKDLQMARRFNFCPILRKDFIIDEYQLYEARSIGADVVLLIARILEPSELHRLAGIAHSLGLEVLVEVHNEAELPTAIHEHVDVIGVNNRDLEDFSVSLEASHALAAQIPADFVKISESGLREAKDLVALRQSGFDGFLIGSHFMRHSRPQDACARLIRDFYQLVQAQG